MRVATRSGPERGDVPETLTDEAAPLGTSQAPTMRDVADRAGVGLATVSRVVNELGSVRPATAERVRAAILELGFQRNEVARALRPGRPPARQARRRACG